MKTLMEKLFWTLVMIGMAFTLVQIFGCESSLITCERDSDCPAHAGTCSQGICITQVSSDNNHDTTDEETTDTDTFEGDTTDVPPDIPPDTDIDDEDADCERNACGGCQMLFATPGTPCAEGCGDGLYVCDDSDAVRCEAGSNSSNACGGCDPLEHPPGESCGECDEGTFVCTGANSTECAGATRIRDWYFVDRDEDGFGDTEVSSLQLCAPMGVYTALRSGDCNDDNADINPDAAEVCDDIDSNCNEGDEPVNACGGCGDLPNSPGDNCGGGTCGQGTWECDEQELVCVPENPDAMLNRCGGCESLPNAPGSPCGSCGVWRCDGSDAVACNDPGLNDCGGCNTLANTPESPCGECGSFVCSGPNTLSCNDPGANACGGCGELPNAPGDSCGQCKVWSCNGSNAVACTGPEPNVCGGCQMLPGAPGSSCGQCGTYACDGAGGLRCNDPGLNACGGCNTLPNAPGDSCGQCGSFVCSGPNTLSCDEENGICQLGEACGADNHCTNGLECRYGSCGGFRRIEPGTFMMGSNQGDSDEREVHSVTLTRPLLVGVTEVTQAEWLSWGFSNPSTNRAGCEECPVNNVDWFLAIAAANAKSMSEGFATCYTKAGGQPYNMDDAVNQLPVLWTSGLNCEGYRLPTEAEWEYIARAGTTTEYWCGATSACLNGKEVYGAGQVEVVCSQQPHPYGVCDIAGNVREWVWDVYAPAYAAQAVTDPLGPTMTREYGVQRGSYYGDVASMLRSSNRLSARPYETSVGRAGLRLVRTIVE